MKIYKKQQVSVRKKNEEEEKGGSSRRKTTSQHVKAPLLVSKTHTFAHAPPPPRNKISRSLSRGVRDTQVRVRVVSCGVRVRWAEGRLPCRT